MIRFAVNSLIVAVCAVVVCASQTGGDVVYLRGGGIEQGEVVEVSDAGLRIRSDDWERTISWDRVRSVTGPKRDEAEAFAVIAEMAWRARYRLERSDPVMAQADFETLYQRYRGTTSPTALVVTEGVLRCRLADSRRSSDAVEPYLQTLRLVRLGMRRTAFLDLPPVIDPRTGLVPSLPPVAHVDSEPSVQIDLSALPRGEDAVIDALADIYAAFVAGAASGVTTTVPGDALDDPGVAIAHAMLGTTSPSDAVRRGSCEDLRAVLRDGPTPWLEAWCRFGVGQALLGEDDPETRLLGVIELLHLPVRLSAAQPMLAQRAGRMGADELESQGYEAYAEQLHADLSELRSAP